jgi:hypothetical protein
MFFKIFKLNYLFEELYVKVFMSVTNTMIKKFIEYSKKYCTVYSTVYDFWRNSNHIVQNIQLTSLNMSILKSIFQSYYTISKILKNFK